MVRTENAEKSVSTLNQGGSGIASDTQYHQIAENDTADLSDGESETFDRRPSKSGNKLEDSLLDDDQMERIEEENIEREERKQYVKKIMNKEKNTPISKLFVLVLCWVIIFTLTLLRGGHGAPSVIGVSLCSPTYWVIFALMFPLMFAITFMVGWYLVKKHNERQELIDAGYRFVEGDPHWTIWNVSFYPIASTLAGLVAGLLGVGGGMIKGPLLMFLGLDPLVAAATASFMILFTSSISAIQFIILGTLPYDYGLWFFVFGLIAGIIGQLLLHFVFATRRRSYIVFCVAFVIFISTLLMTAFGIYNAVFALENGLYMGFHNVC